MGLDRIRCLHTSMFDSFVLRGREVHFAPYHPTIYHRGTYRRAQTTADTIPQLMPMEKMLDTPGWNAMVMHER